MDEAQRKLMVTMAKNLEALGKEFVSFKGGAVVIPSGQTVKNEGGVIHTISFDRAPSEAFKMDVQFEDSLNVPFNSRQNKCKVFLKDMEEILKSHGVTKLSGTYVR